MTEFQVQLDRSVLVVPVYVHIMRDNKNNTSSSTTPYNTIFTTGTLPSQTNPTNDEQIAWNMGQLFDQTAVRYPYWPIVYQSTFVEGVPEKLLDPSWKRTHTSQDGDGGVTEVPVYADDIFGQCEQFSPPSRPVQLRLMGVSFIRQGLGLETNLSPSSEILPPNPQLTCEQIRSNAPTDPNFCFSSNAGRLAQQLVTAYDHSGLPKGVHVIVGGGIWPGRMVCDSLVAGFSCLHSRFSLVDATGAANSKVFDTQTIFHEIGHLLTMHGEHSDDPNNLMFAYAAAGGKLTQEQCNWIANNSSAY